jgi:octaprenyl-diphosphate synthase
MLPFQEPVQDDFTAVNQLIIEQLHSNVGLVENIGHYLVEAGGKRLRPMLVLLAAKALNYKGQDQLKLAAIIEFIHTATLLHDDVVDLSNLRRGRLTANAKWGNAPSVLVGDFLYSRAFQLMVSIGDMAIMDILANTTNIISEGEVQQLVNAKNPNIDEQAYFDVIYKKTAILFSAACETAAVIANSDDKTRESMKQYGYHVGMAFQLIDDVLDYSGDSDALGKNVGDDLAEGKPTLPLIIAMRKGANGQAQIVADALRQGNNGSIDQIVTIVRQTGGLRDTENCAREHIQFALRFLSSLPDSPYKQALQALAEFSANRQY